MKKYFFATAMALLMVACSKPLEEPVNPGNNTDKVAFSFHATPVSFETKTTVDGLTAAWEEMDKIQLFNAAEGSYNYKSVGEFLYAGENLFNGNIKKKMTEGQYNWLAVYPSNSRSQVTFAGSMIQDGSNSTAHLAGKNFPLYAAVDNKGAEGLDFQMKNMATVFEINLKNITQEELVLTMLSLTASVELAGSYTLAYEGSELVLTPVSPNKNKTVTLKMKEPLPLESKDEAVLYIATRPFSLPAGAKLVFNINGYQKEIELKQDESFVSGQIRKFEVPYDNGVVLPDPPVEGDSVWDGTYGEIMYDGGEGTAASPFLIKSAAHFAALAAYVNKTADPSFKGQYFRLETDIDLAAKPFKTIGVVATDSAFDGVLDGNGHVIRNINIVPASEDKREKDYLGLFRNNAADTRICNLVLENVTVKGDPQPGGYPQAAGALFAQFIDLSGVIEGVTVINPVIEAGMHAGGLVGIGGVENSKSADMLIKDCHVYGGRISGLNAGGLYGVMRSGTLIACSTATEVNGQQCAGALVGQGYLDGVPDAQYVCDNVIAGCYTNSKVFNKKNILTSGIAATYKGSISGCYTVSQCSTGVNPAFPNKNMLVSNYVYRVQSAPEATVRFEETISASYAPLSTEPIHKLFYHIHSTPRVEVPKENNGYYFFNEEQQKQAPKASYMEFKRPKQITQKEVDAMNTALEALSGPEFFGLNNWRYELSADNEYGFPAVLVNNK